MLWWGELQLISSPLQRVQRPEVRHRFSYGGGIEVGGMLDSGRLSQIFWCHPRKNLEPNSVQKASRSSPPGCRGVKVPTETGVLRVGSFVG